MPIDEETAIKVTAGTSDVVSQEPWRVLLSLCRHPPRVSQAPLTLRCARLNLRLTTAHRRDPRDAALRHPLRFANS